MADENNDTSGPNGENNDYVEIEDSIATCIKVNLDDLYPSTPESTCIYRVYEKLRKLNVDAYTPGLIAIGPYHHRKKKLKAMEDYKLQCIKKFLTSTKTWDAESWACTKENLNKEIEKDLEKCVYDEGIKKCIKKEMFERKWNEYIIKEVEEWIKKQLEECTKAIRKLEQDIRKCYSEKIDLKENKLIEMMVVDGLFIIGFFLYSSDRTNWRKRKTLMNDILLLEKQMPMFVLKALFEVITLDAEKDFSLVEGILIFFLCSVPEEFLFFTEDDIRESNRPLIGLYENSNHLLDFLGKTLHASFKNTKHPSRWKHLPCVTKLHQAGVKFRKGEGKLFDIKFEKGEGVLHIPPLCIEDSTEPFLRNLIALEQCCFGDETCISSYAVFMDSLINSADDVGLLCRCGIIVNCLGNDEDVATLFNKLCLDVTIFKFYYSEICDLVNDYHDTRWHVWKTAFKRNYFSSPWKILSFFAGILLLILTFTGTLFSILSFTIHKS